MKIAHLTSAHPRHDVRIFARQCRSLAAAGHQVTLVVADGNGEEMRDGVAITDAGRSRSRFARMTGATYRVFTKAKALEADVYQLHDPELLPVGLALKKAGNRVIFDAHEDVPLQILAKDYLPAFMRPAVSASFAVFERLACRRLDAVIAATPAIREKFARIGIRTQTVANFPLEDEFAAVMSGNTKAAEVCYVGAISRIRGIRQVVEAIGLCRADVRLNLVGALGDGLKAELACLPGWQKVNAYGFLPRREVARVLARSAAGLVTFLPSPNHTAAQPNKMFEYMAAGIAVIASDFPLWREIVEGTQSGICVDPSDPVAIAAAIDRVAGNPEEMRRMGANGYRAVMTCYNWRSEERKLLGLYSALGQGLAADETA
jgi:glycosyltransferase involved in cell wall biosynthesis